MSRVPADRPPVPARGRPDPAAPTPGAGGIPELGPAASRRVRARDEALAAGGWTRRFIGSPPRLEELIALYRSLGHEVRTEPLEEGDLEHECAGCGLALSLFRIVYTRIPR